MRYVDKEKALNYLHLSAPIAEASDNAELSSATKVVKEFENPSIDKDTLFRDGDDVQSFERASIRDAYEERLRSGFYQSQEAFRELNAKLSAIHFFSIFAAQY